MMEKAPGKVPSSTFNALVKVLHPDTPMPTDKQRGHACGLLTDWKRSADGR
jgi:hypothetical protein